MGANSVAAIAYNFYWIVAFGALWAVASYLRTYRRKMTPATLAFSVGAAINFAGDAVSKAWFWVWRWIGKPQHLVDHPIVIAITVMAAFGILLAIRFWTHGRYGEIAWARIALAAGLGAGLLGMLMH